MKHVYCTTILGMVGCMVIEIGSLVHVSSLLWAGYAEHEHTLL